MSMSAILAMMGAGGAGAGALPPLSELVTFKCAVCIDTLGPDARKATTLAHGTLTCDEHAAQLVTRAECDSDNLDKLRELAEHFAGRAVASSVAAIVANYHDATATMRQPTAEECATLPNATRWRLFPDSDSDSATPDSDSDTRQLAHECDPELGPALCPTCRLLGQRDTATGAGQ